MIPRVSTYLETLARQLGEQVSARLPTAYEQAGMLREPMHLQAVRVEFERAVQRRVEENKAIRGLLVRAATIDRLCPELRAQCAQEAATPDEDLHVSALQASNDRLRLSLILLQTALETLTEQQAQCIASQQSKQSQAQAQAQALLDDLWQELRISTERRRLPSDRF